MGKHGLVNSKCIIHMPKCWLIQRMFITYFPRDKIILKQANSYKIFYKFQIMSKLKSIWGISNFGLVCKLMPLTKMGLKGFRHLTYLGNKNKQIVIWEMQARFPAPHSPCLLYDEGLILYPLLVNYLTHSLPKTPRIPEVTKIHKGKFHRSNFQYLIQIFTHSSWIDSFVDSFINNKDQERNNFCNVCMIWWYIKHQCI